jgi:putative two-component system response regulator
VDPLDTGDPPPPTGSCVVVVSDDPATVLGLERVLARAGLVEVHTALDPRRAAPVMREVAPDLLILDADTRDLEPRALTRQAGRHCGGDPLPILVLARPGAEGADLARAAGATDLLRKPLDLAEAVLRVGTLLEGRRLRRALRCRLAELEVRAERAAAEAESTTLEALERLCRAVEVRDGATGRHTRRIGDLAAALGRAIGLTPQEVEMLRRAAPLHDVGKIGIPDAILLKPSRLDADEMAVMRGHAALGAKILNGSRSRAMRLARIIAESHHERWDGAGYPAGLRGHAIPIEARIVALVDAFDALTHERPYRPATSTPAALAELRAAAGSHFDPELVEPFVRIVRERAAGTRAAVRTTR